MAGRAALRVIYRARQFWEAVHPRLDPAALEAAEALLPDGLWRLFRQMPPSEQAHALRVFRRLQALGCADPDLLTAALLHDVGKALRHPRLWERVAVVLAHRCCPRRARQWGEGEPKGWRRPFVLAARHPAWGAALAAEAGASERTVALIRQHHTRDLHDAGLALLQEADEQE